MSFIDSVSSTLNRGKDNVVRTGKTAQLKYQVGELVKERQNYMAQLGASLYDEVRNDPRLTSGREGLFEKIASIDAQRGALEAEIAQLEQETAGAQTFKCPKCGATIQTADMFCSGCGTPVSELRASADVAASAADSRGTCPHCGAPVEDGDAFCMNCGTKIAASPESATAEPEHAPLEPEVVDDGEQA